MTLGTKRHGSRKISNGPESRAPPHAHHFPVRRMLEDGPVMGDCDCGMTFEQWEDSRDYD